MTFRVFVTLGLLCPFSAIFAAPPETNYLPAASQLDRLESTTIANDSQSTKRINNNDLLAQPELAKMMLDQAVRDGQWPIVRAILPVYADSHQPDMMLIHFARGGLARSEGRYDLAIKHYRAILSAHPDFDAVRLEMARAMYENRQADAAEYQFRRVLSSNPPDNIQQSIGYYLERIQQGSPLTGRFSVSYLNDSNVNNASSTDTIRIGDRLFIRDKDSLPQRGEGVQFNAALQKDISLLNHHGLRFLGTIYGKSYWNNHRFDDITGRIYAGYQWRDFRQLFAVLPFYEQRWYGTDSYSSGPGVRAEYSYLLSPRWQISQALEYQKLGYDNSDYAFLRGHNRFSSTTLSHALNSRISLWGGVDLLDQQTRTQGESNHRIGLRTGLQVDLPWKISFSGMGAFSRRFYQGQNDIFLSTRRDNEQYYSLALWHRDFELFGLMPKLNLTYKRLNSNIDFYDYHQRNISISLDKNF